MCQRSNVTVAKCAKNCLPIRSTEFNPGFLVELCVAQSFVFYVVACTFMFVPFFSFGHCIICTSSSYDLFYLLGIFKLLLSHNDLWWFSAILYYYVKFDIFFATNSIYIQCFILLIDLHVKIFASIMSVYYWYYAFV